MDRKAIVRVQQDEEGAFIEFPREWNIDASDAIWVIEDDKYVLHLDAAKYRRKVWFDTFTKLEAEIGRLPYKDWKSFCRMIRHPKNN